MSAVSSKPSLLVGLSAPGPQILAHFYKVEVVDVPVLTLGHGVPRCPNNNDELRVLVEKAVGRPEGAHQSEGEHAFPSAYLLVSSIGICVDSCKLIRRSIRRSI
jgi:hypothetical protein